MRSRAASAFLVLCLGVIALPFGAWAQVAPVPGTPGPPELQLPRLFSDGLVVQRGVPVPVRGRAAPGARVAVGFAGRTRQALADAAGQWSTTFPALKAGGPLTLTVEASGKRIEVRDILVGDVWVASGQSNMEFALANAANGPAAVAAAHDPLLREFAVPHSWSDSAQQDLVGGSWTAADSQHAGRFSAVAYFFARDLRTATGVPIGIIHTSWGGSNIETWMSRRALGIGDSAWNALAQQERAQSDAVRDSLRARLGGLPSADSGLVEGRALWADPALNDDAWMPMPVPSLWEVAGLPGLDGIVWYRTSFTLTEEEARQGARLSLGMIDDDDITWVNGSEVGRTEGYNRPRLYTVPATALHAGTNVLAVRVVDSGGGGGPYGDPSGFYIEAGSARHPLAGTWKLRVGAVSFQPDGQRINKIPSVLYNRMIHPLLPYPIKGVIWYQGESNADSDAQAAAYRLLFAGLIRSWRSEWNPASAGFPFLWVQLPNFGARDSAPPARAAWATLRESQTAALALPRTGQVVIIDLGNPDDIHPRAKEPVGQRLARVARRVAYGEALAASGPTYRRHALEGGRVIVEFDHVGGGLVSHGGGAGVGGFAVAGADRRFVWAQARIEGNHVVVWSDAVANPVAIRYAWGNDPENASLFNADGLPAAPFRTDSW